MCKKRDYFSKFCKFNKSLHPSVKKSISFVERTFCESVNKNLYHLKLFMTPGHPKLSEPGVPAMKESSSPKLLPGSQAMHSGSTK